MISFRQADLLEAIQPKPEPAVGSIHIYAADSTENSKPVLIFQIESNDINFYAATLVMQYFGSKITGEFYEDKQGRMAWYEVYKMANTVMLSDVRKIRTAAQQLGLTEMPCGDPYLFRMSGQIPCVAVYGFGAAQLAEMTKPRPA